MNTQYSNVLNFILNIILTCIIHFIHALLYTGIKFEGVYACHSFIFLVIVISLIACAVNMHIIGNLLGLQQIDKHVIG